jgi:hypothetical protein
MLETKKHPTLTGPFRTHHPRRPAAIAVAASSTGSSPSAHVDLGLVELGGEGRLSPDLEAHIVRLSSEAWTTTSIARRLGVGLNTVRRLVRSHRNAVERGEG